MKAAPLLRTDSAWDLEYEKRVFSNLFGAWLRSSLRSCVV
jgi:hypothetical protein